MMRIPRQPETPVFSRPKQASTDALIPVPEPYGDLRNVAIDHLPMHCIRRLFKAGVYEPDDLAVEFCDNGCSLRISVRWMLPILSVARRYRLNCGCRIAFWIKLGMIFSTLEKRAGNTLRIFWNSGADLNCCEDTDFAPSGHRLAMITDVSVRPRRGTSSRCMTRTASEHTNTINASANNSP